MEKVVHNYFSSVMVNSEADEIGSKVLGTAEVFIGAVEFGLALEGFIFFLK